MAAPAPVNTGATLSEAQFTALLSGVIQSLQSQTQAAPAPTPATATVGNFVACTARFDGKKNDADAVEAFIDNIVTYKECANVPDHIALRGMPMLLTGEAAVWWQGIKATVQTWDDAIKRLRNMFGAPRPAHWIFREIFAREQEDEHVDSFVLKIRAHFARLPYEVPEKMKIDIIYGLLSDSIRKCVPRENIDSIDCLLERARYVRHSVYNVNPLNADGVPDVQEHRFDQPSSKFSNGRYARRRGGARNGRL
ncbi:activity-regulated cytoskeleton associated protein 2-like [Aricia agestis]|uniref:activity-regulated cytoskeleton associated protein 2-like n=1 Tax=Aricia agestis TaxID=91739 RepID=UPI001C205EAF|nr:activity-regulated cytoskeleton associated protein 2-like [Aricia agestis]